MVFPCDVDATYMNPIDSYSYKCNIVHNVTIVHKIYMLVVVTLFEAMSIDAITVMLVTDLHEKMLTNAQPVIIHVIPMRVT